MGLMGRQTGKYRYREGERQVTVMKFGAVVMATVILFFAVHHLCTLHLKTTERQLV